MSTSFEVGDTAFIKTGPEFVKIVRGWGDEINDRFADKLPTYKFISVVVVLTCLNEAKLSLKLFLRKC